MFHRLLIFGSALFATSDSATVPLSVAVCAAPLQLHIWQPGLGVARHYLSFELCAGEDETAYPPQQIEAESERFEWLYPYARGLNVRQVRTPDGVRAWISIGTARSRPVDLDTDGAVRPVTWTDEEPGDPEGRRLPRLVVRLETLRPQVLGWPFLKVLGKDVSVAKVTAAIAQAAGLKLMLDQPLCAEPVTIHYEAIDSHELLKLLADTCMLDLRPRRPGRVQLGVTRDGQQIYSLLESGPEASDRDDRLTRALRLAGDAGPGDIGLLLVDPATELARRAADRGEFAVARRHLRRLQSRIEDWFGQPDPDVLLLQAKLEWRARRPARTRKALDRLLAELRKQDADGISEAWFGARLLEGHWLVAEQRLVEARQCWSEALRLNDLVPWLDDHLSHNWERHEQHRAELLALLKGLKRAQ